MLKKILRSKATIRTVCVLSFAAGCLIALKWTAVERVLLGRLRALVESELTAELGSPVRVERLSLSASGLVLHKVGVASVVGRERNSPRQRLASRLGAKGPELFAQRVELDVSWWQILRNAGVRPQHIALERVQLVLPTDVFVEDRDSSPLAFARGLQRDLFHSGVSSVKVRGLNVVGPSVIGPRNVGGSLRLAGASLAGVRDQHRIIFSLEAEEVSIGGQALGALSARVVTNAVRLHIEQIELGSGNSSASVSGSMSWSDPGPYAIYGRLTLQSQVLDQVFRFVSDAFLEKMLVQAARVTARFSVLGSFEQADDWFAHGRLQLRDPLARVPGLPEPVGLDSLAFRAELSPSGLRLSGIRARAAGLVAIATFEAPKGRRHQLNGRVRFEHLDVLRRFTLDAPLIRHVRHHRRQPSTPVEVAASIRWHEGDAHVAGTLVGGGLELRVPAPVGFWVADRVSAQFDYRSRRPERLLLEHVRLSGPAGHVRGRILADGDSHRAELRLRQLRAAMLNGTIPGTVRGGRLHGTVVVEGSSQRPSMRVDGTLTVKAARWQPPWAWGPPVEVRHASVRLRKRGERWEFSHASVDALAQLDTAAPQSPAAIKLGGDGVLASEGHRLNLALEQVDARLLTMAVPGRVLRGTLRGSFVVKGTTGAPFSHLSGDLSLSRATWQPPIQSGAVKSLHFHKVSSSLRRSNGVWSFTNLSVAASVPNIVEHVAFQGGVTLDPRAKTVLREVSGRLRFNNGTWRPNKGHFGLGAIELERGSADITRRGLGPWRLSNVVLELPFGSARGSASFSRRGHRASLRLALSAPHALNEVLPGRLKSGALRATVELAGTRDEPLAAVSGGWNLSHASWAPPTGAGLCTESITIKESNGAYRWDGQALKLTQVRVATDLFFLNGHATHKAGVTRIHSDFRTDQAGRLLGLTPAFSGVFLGGGGAGTLTIHAASTGVSGLLEARVTDGSLALAALDKSEAAIHPMDDSTFAFDFSPLRSNLRHLRMRGPEVNLDLAAVWYERGPVAGNGRIWLTRPYTRVVAKGAGWALDLLGYPRIDTGFTLRGTEQEVRMNAAIAHGWRWRLLRTGVPVRLQKIARGEMPVLTRSEGVCQR